MNEWLETLFSSDFGARLLEAESTVFMMLLAFVIGHLVGFIYIWTHEGLSYSRTFVASLVVLPMIIAIMMTVVAGSVLVAFGLLAVFGVIRFRNVLKDTRDTTFLLWAVMEGLAVGTMRYSTALAGSLGVAAVLLYLRLTSFGTRSRYDAVLSLRLTGDLALRLATLNQVLYRYASRSKLATQRRLTDAGADVTFRILLRDAARCDELRSELSRTEGLENVTVFLQEDEAEV
ncbi:MAG: DUF4956 domain-containing protein [Thermoguttaceae bacterium]